MTSTKTVAPGTANAAPASPAAATSAPKAPRAKPTPGATKRTVAGTKAAPANAKPKAADAANPPKAAPARKPATGATRPRAKARMSALDAAAQVLVGLPSKAAAEGLSAGELIERMARERLWVSPGGKTPAATLYAAMVREISKRKDESRFRRPAPGRFASGESVRRGAKAQSPSRSVPAAERKGHAAPKTGTTTGATGTVA
jgi:hypothetical protein